MDIDKPENESQKAKTIVVLLAVLVLAFAAFLYLINRKERGPIAPAVDKTDEASFSGDKGTGTALTPEAPKASDVSGPTDYPDAPADIKSSASSQAPDSSAVTPPNPFPENE